MKEHRYYSASDFYKTLFGQKVYKIALDAGCTCPTRDGTKGNRGCIFCSGTGSGDFATTISSINGDRSLACDNSLNYDSSIDGAKNLVSSKLHGRSKTTGGKYIAYFQNFSNTYGDASRLESLYRKAVSQPDVVGISIATRPDCLQDDILSRIAKLSQETFVSIELGLQTVNDKTANYIRRGYTLDVYKDAVLRIRKANPKIHIVTHIIFGLPGETLTDMLNTVRYCAGLVPNNSELIPLQNTVTSELAVDGIKISVLHVLEGTDLADDWRKGLVPTLSMDEYFAILADAVNNIPPNIVIHRLTGDGPKKLLLAPLWTADKKRVLNALNKYFEEHNVIQGSALTEFTNKQLIKT